ncbi:MAG: hypothetical protein H0Z33_00970 [Bacillaceae bacterium]|nr:hypothetical protein [Bacillaceae bacterium]
MKMITRKAALFLLMMLVGLLAIAMVKIAGYEAVKTDDHDTINLTGESDNWRLEHYRLRITPDTFMAGEGKLYYKSDPDGLNTDFYQIRVYAVIDDQIRALQGKSVSGDIFHMNLKQITTGSTEGLVLTHEGRPIKLADIEEIYAVIKWREENGEMLEEKISLFNQML